MDAQGTDCGDTEKLGRGDAPVLSFARLQATGPDDVRGETLPFSDVVAGPDVSEVGVLLQRSGGSRQAKRAHRHVYPKPRL